MKGFPICLRVVFDMTRSGPNHVQVKSGGCTGKLHHFVPIQNIDTNDKAHAGLFYVHKQLFETVI